MSEDEATAAAKKPLVLYFDPAGPRVQVVPGVDSRETFTAAFNDLPAGDLEIDVVVTKGHARVAAIRITEKRDSGVKGVALDEMPVQRLLEREMEAHTWLENHGRDLDQIRQVQKTTRRRLSGDRLEHVAEAYRRDGYKAVMQDQHVGERHARRLIKEAVEHGLIPERNDGKLS